MHYKEITFATNKIIIHYNDCSTKDNCTYCLTEDNSTTLTSYQVQQRTDGQELALYIHHLLGADYAEADLHQILANEINYCSQLTEL